MSAAGLVAPSPGLLPQGAPPPVPRDPVSWSSLVQRERDKELPSPGTRDLSCPFWFLFLTAALWRGWEWLPALSQVPGKQEWKEEGFYFLLPDLPCPSQFSYLTIPNDFVGILR